MELQHLTPNGIQHIAASVTLCEGFLGIGPHYNQWQYIFAVNLVKRRVGQQELHAPVGCASIHLHNNQAGAYPLMHLSTSNKGWHSQWFYVRDGAAAPLPVFSRRFIVESPGPWSWGIPVKEKKHVNDLLVAL